MKLVMKFRYIFLLFFIFVLISCPPPVTGNNNNDDDDDDDSSSWGGTNYYLTIDGSSFTTRAFKQIASGSNCTVWSDEASNLSSSQAQDIISEFDGTIYGTVTTTFASNYDVDGDGKVAIFVHSGDDGSSGSYIGGYFYAADFYNNSNSNPYSNEKDIIYMNGAPSNHKVGSQGFNRTIAHEFQHLCNFSYNVVTEHSANSNYQMYTWMDEGMAENASSLSYGFSSGQSRISWYASDYYGNFGDGNISLTLWNSHVDNYSLVYAFFAYLYDQSSTIFSSIYANTSNNTTACDSVITSVLGTSLDDEFKSFIHDFRYTSSAFPSNFFPSGFSVVTSGSANATLMPYAFLYRPTGDFNSCNGDLVYLNSSGTTTTNSSLSVAVTWLDNSSWSDNTVSSWSGTEENTNSQSATIIPSSNINKSIGQQTPPPMPVDFVFDLSNLDKLQKVKRK